MVHRFRAAWRWLTSRGWWRYQTALAVAGVMLAATALVGALTSYVDELDDAATNQSQRVDLERLKFEQECRSDLVAEVDRYASLQLDGMSDLLVAVADRNRPEIRRLIGILGKIKADKDDAVAARTNAVEICSRRAEALGIGKR